jgi:hypothetical protein
MRSVALALLSVVVLASCATGPAAPDGVFFPTLTKTQNAWPMALLSGSLVDKDGCVLLMPSDVLLIWPHGTSAERTGAGDLRITIGGRLVGNTGDRVDLGGGLLGESKDTTSKAEGMIGEAIPERCRADGGYWLTAPPS